MKEAIGTSFVFNLIMVFVAIMIALFVGSLAYSKGFKVRNRVIDIIEKHGGYTEAAQKEIDENLSTIGYRISTDATKQKTKCSEQFEKHMGAESGSIEQNNTNTNYNYCVFSYNTSKGLYYGVTVYIHFDVPFLGDFFEIPVYGETRVIFEKSGVTG